MNRQDDAFWLVVEENERDYWLFRRACRSVRGCRTLLWLRDELEAESFLSDQRNRVAAIVIGNPPQAGGLRLLASARERDWLKATPVFLLFKTGSERDVRDALDLGASDYKVRPRQPWMLARIIEQWAANCAQAAPAPSAPPATAPIVVSFGSVDELMHGC